MNASHIAAKLSIYKKKYKDENLWLLNSMKLIGSNNIDEIISKYKDIQSGKIQPAIITSSSELSNDQKNKIEGKLNAQNLDIIFVYEVDKSVDGGIQILIGDNILTFD